MIRFKMFRINVDQFAMIEEPVNPTGISFGTTLNMDFSLSDRNVRIRMGFSFVQNDKKIMLLNVACEFNIHEDDWGNVDNGENFVYPKYFIECLLTQVVGTARGILHCKTEGTSFNNIIIPPIDVTKMIDGDIVINRHPAQ